MSLKTNSLDELNRFMIFSSALAGDSGNTHTTGAILIAAILVIGRSCGSGILSDHGLSAKRALGYISFTNTTDDNDENISQTTNKAKDLQKVRALIDDPAQSILTAQNGLVDLAPNTTRSDALTSRIAAAKTHISDLIDECERGNQHHARLGDYAKAYRDGLSGLTTPTPAISWYIHAQKIENYRSNYAAVSRDNPLEYPPLEPWLSTSIDAVVLATGIIARLFPEIAECQDQFIPDFPDDRAIS